MASTQSSSSSSGSHAPKTAKSKRGRGVSKWPEGRLTITVVSPDGIPLEPSKAAKSFRTTCGIIGRQRVPITIASWKDLTKDHKNQLWEELTNSFEFPAEAQGLVQRQALLAMGKAWKNFKSTLVTKYVAEDVTPFTKYPFVSPETWEAFVQMKTTPEFVQQSAAHKDLQSQNTHPHRLGTAGYAGKIPQWRMQDEVAIRSEASPPFAGIANERARNWLRARSSTTSSGVSFKNPADEEVSQRMVKYVKQHSC